MDETLPANYHTVKVFRARGATWAECACGWHSVNHGSQFLAQRAWSAHVAQIVLQERETDLIHPDLLPDTHAADRLLTVCMTIQGKNAAQGALAAELVYEFKFNNDLALLTSFEENMAQIEFVIEPSRYELVVRFVTRLKAYGLTLQTDILPA